MKQDVKKDIESRLKLLKVMKDRNMTSVELSERIGITPRAVRQFVNGEKEPSLRRLYTIADALGISVKELFAF